MHIYFHIVAFLKNKKQLCSDVSKAETPQLGSIKTRLFNYWYYWTWDISSRMYKNCIFLKGKKPNNFGLGVSKLEFPFLKEITEHICITAWGRTGWWKDHFLFRPPIDAWPHVKCFLKARSHLRCWPGAWLTWTLIFSYATDFFFYPY